MANDLNLCQFIGRLGKDPQTAFTPNGTAVTKLSIAVGEQWKDKQSGQKQERTTWVPVVAFGRLAEVMGEYLKKGSQIYLSGKFSVRKWKAEDGSDRWTTEIVASEMQMLDGGTGTGQSSQPQHQPAQSKPAPASGGYAADPGWDEDYPF
jgi:single-strand DNA-binding protein